MKLSVVVPVYNGEEVLLRCLNSIKNQTYRDMELIIVNDGSTDHTKSVINKFNESIHDIEVVVIDQKNKGNSLARKSGIDVARGEYVGFIDADDWIEPNYFNSLMHLAETKNADMVCSEITQDIGNKKRVEAHDTSKTVLTGEEAIKLLHQRKAVYQYMANKIIKKNLLEKVTFPAKNMIGEDYTIIVQILCLSNNIVLSRERGYHYVILENSLSHAGYNDSFKNAINTYPLIEKHITSLFPDCKKDISNFMLQNYMGAIMAMCKNQNYDLENLRWIHKYVKSHLKDFILYSPFAIYWKVGVTIFAINTKVFCCLCNVFR